MDKLKALEIVTAYYRAVCEAYRLGNTESAYILDNINNCGFS